MAYKFAILGAVGIALGMAGFFLQDGPIQAANDEASRRAQAKFPPVSPEEFSWARQRLPGFLENSSVGSGRRYHVDSVAEMTDPAELKRAYSIIYSEAKREAERVRQRAILKPGDASTSQAISIAAVVGGMVVFTFSGLTITGSAVSRRSR